MLILLLVVQAKASPPVLCDRWSMGAGPRGDKDVVVKVDDNDDDDATIDEDGTCADARRLALHSWSSSSSLSPCRSMLSAWVLDAGEIWRSFGC